MNSKQEIAGNSLKPSASPSPLQRGASEAAAEVCASSQPNKENQDLPPRGNEDEYSLLEQEGRGKFSNFPSIAVVIPAHDEAEGILKVIQALPMEWVQEVVVTDNASNDDTAGVAEALGATVLREDRKGYGWACLKALEYLEQKPQQPEIVVFLDADYSDYPEELPLLVKPIQEGTADMVIGSRALGEREKGSLTPQQVFGNWLATRLLYLIYGERFTDLGPFRAIRWEALQQINMQDKTYGWTVEMQIKAAKLGLRSAEVPVRYRRRIGHSKVSGTLKGVIGAGYKILWTLFRYSR